MQAISQGTEGAATACHCTIFPDLAKGSLLRLDDGLNRQRVKVSAYLPLKLSLWEMLARGVWDLGGRGRWQTAWYVDPVPSHLVGCLLSLFLSQGPLDFKSTRLAPLCPGFAALTWLPITTGGTLDLGLQALPRPPLQPPLPSLCTAFSQLRIWTRGSLWSLLGPMWCCSPF